MITDYCPHCQNYGLVCNCGFAPTDIVLTFEDKLKLAVVVLEMLEDHRKMPHQHSDPYLKLCCLTERAREALKTIRGDAH